MTSALVELQRHCDQFDTQSEAAESLGISPAYLRDLLRARRDISENMLSKLGLKRVITIVKEKSA